MWLMIQSTGLTWILWKPRIKEFDDPEEDSRAVSLVTAQLSIFLLRNGSYCFSNNDTLLLYETDVLEWI